MKLSRKDCECRVLKHLITSPKAIIKSNMMRITGEHFIYNEEGSTDCYTKSLFNLAQKYYAESNGYCVTSLVLENKLVAYGVSDAVKGKFLECWAAVQEQEYDENDLYALLMHLKNTRALTLYNEMIQKSYELVKSEGVSKGLPFVQNKVDEIYSELDDSDQLKEQIDVNQSAEYFEQEYTLRQTNPERYSGIPCGMPQLDDKTFGLMPGQIAVLLAPSSGGKSVQLLNWAHYANASAGKSVLYFSFEMPLWQCLMRHLSLAWEIPYTALKSVSLKPDGVRELINKMKSLDGGPYFEYDVSMNDPTPEYVDARIRELSTTKGKPDLVVVDYIGNMTSRDSRPSAPPYEKQGDAFFKLFMLAKKHDVPIYTAQQINRDTIRESRKAKESGKAAAFYQDAASGDQRVMHYAHFVIGMDPDKEKKRVGFYPIKMRDAWFAPFGAEVVPEHNGIYELSREHQEEWQKDNGFGERDSDSSSNSSVPKLPRVKPSSAYQSQATGTKPKDQITYEWKGTDVVVQEDDINFDMDWGTED